MTLYDAMLERHSVRQYTDKKIEPEKIEILKNKIDEINKKSGLYISLCTEEPEAFQANKPSYGSFSGCKTISCLPPARGATRI